MIEYIFLGIAVAAATYSIVISFQTYLINRETKAINRETKAIIEEMKHDDGSAI